MLDGGLARIGRETASRGAGNSGTRVSKATFTPHTTQADHRTWDRKVRAAGDLHDAE